MTSLRLRSAILPAFFILVAGGCAGSTGTGDGGDATPGDATGDVAADVGTDAAVSPCPSTAPANGTACSRDGLACQFGSDPRSECRPIARCTAGSWMVTTPTCPTISPPAMCPASREAANGMACTTMDQVCGYGSFACRCTNCRRFPVEVCMGPLTWQCDEPSVQMGCPAAVPNLGEPCASEMLNCTYSCERHGERGARRCMNGIWTESFNNCPISTRRLKTNITYLDRSTRDRLAGELLRTRLATYEYTLPSRAGRRNLGFIIEDQPAGSFAVDGSGAMVDLYGYSSMLVATVQRQNEEIAELRRAIERLERGSHSTDRSARSTPRR